MSELEYIRNGIDVSLSDLGKNKVLSYEELFIIYEGQNKHNVFCGYINCKAQYEIHAKGRLTIWGSIPPKYESIDNITINKIKEINERFNCDVLKIPESLFEQAIYMRHFAKPLSKTLGKDAMDITKSEVLESIEKKYKELE